jgi:hypothetical protein
MLPPELYEMGLVQDYNSGSSLACAHGSAHALTVEIAAKPFVFQRLAAGEF